MLPHGGCKELLKRVISYHIILFIKGCAFDFGLIIYYIIIKYYRILSVSEICKSLNIQLRGLLNIQLLKVSLAALTVSEFITDSEYTYLDYTQYQLR